MSITDAISRLAYGLCNMSSWTSSNDADCVSIASAFLDPAPIDEAWLREMGFHGCGHRDLLRCQGSNLFYSRGLRQLQWSITPMSGINTEPTRGRFRALLHGLGMEVRG